MKKSKPCACPGTKAGDPYCFCELRERGMFKSNVGDKIMGLKNIREFSAEEIKHWDCQTETVDGWKLARPEGYYYTGLGGLKRRFRLAWKVFTGRVDVLTWHKQ